MNELASRWEGFNLDEYRRLLDKTIERLPPRGIEVVTTDAMTSERFCIIRHDIDISPDAALDVARVERDLGVRATYSVLLTGPFYNAFEERTRDTLLEIASLGHAMVLHFDAAWHKIEDERSLDGALRWEAKMLSNLLGGYPIDSFAFHNTTDFTLACRQISYAGLLNFYSTALQDNVRYVSDSNGHWRFASWRDVLAENPDRLQVLTHPEWWPRYDASPAEKVCRYLDARERQTWDQYVEILKSSGRENLSPVPEAFDTLATGDDWERSVLQRWLCGDRDDAYRRLETRLGSEEASSSGASEARFNELAASLRRQQ